MRALAAERGLAPWYLVVGFMLPHGSWAVPTQVWSGAAATRPAPIKAAPFLVLVVQGCSGSSFVWRTLVHDLLPLHGVAVYSEHHGVRLDKELLNGRKGFTKLLADEGVSSTD